MSPDAVVRRSCLSVPASDQGKVDKAAGLGADEIVFDLEDSVVAEAKEQGRAVLAARLPNLVRSGRTVAVRVNPVGTSWCHQEVLSLTGDAAPASFVLPKASCPGDVAFLDRLLSGIEAAGGSDRSVGIQVLIESPDALHRVDELAAASPRVQSLILGYADLGSALGISYRDLDVWLPVQHAVLLAARRHGLQAIDGPHLAYTDDAGQSAANQRARELGFDGKWVIHPRQVAYVNQVFTPTDDELRRARTIEAAMEAAERGGTGAVAVDGEMIDPAVVLGARRTLARAAAAEAT
ncbi:CoA ester lyase [Actinomadura darangshiensis]|uniref:CoA ester lyase n=1 Tax=Actinomadura darangshiensis TaxID=705336 RepID=A0A4R5BK60_9ACTN|nr:CoA ester lyase [Actinomadura darangshiensis]TDD84182.1 CoA ester lyase [Actinomadura darangshiensis]